MMIPPIAAIAPITPLSSAAPAAAPAAAGASGTSFAGELAKGFDAVSGAQANADNLAVQAATGTLTDPAQYTVAATEASMMTQLAVAIQSKGVTAFNTIMGMQA